ncbi:MAG: ATP-binding protein [Myxococcota bacterium]
MSGDRTRQGDLGGPGVGDEKQRFSVDIQGLLEALTEQFPEPLLCVRELVQNAADAGAHRIEVDTSYDSRRGMFRLQVLDDGRGMNAAEVDGYLTIGFSEKEAGKERGRFGVGKLSPYALDIVRMVVETSDGQVSHRITFNRDGSGQIAKPETRARGTVVRVYKACPRAEAEKLTARTFELVAERCGSINIPLFVNGERVNRSAGLPTPYAWAFHSSDGDGVLGITAEPIRELMGGGIVLETGAPILGEDVSYILDSPRLAPTLSRNAVRRDHAFDAILRAAQGALPTFVEKVAGQLAERVAELRQQAGSVERGLDPNDRAALEWLRSQLLLRDDEEPQFGVQRAPVLETADGGLVSALELRDVIRREGRVPASRVPRTRDELSAYADRGVPVLLLYRDLEDFLERQGIQTVEVDGADDGLEIEPGRYSAGELALAQRPPIRAPRPERRRATIATFALAASTALVVVLWRDAQTVPEAAPTVAVVRGAPAVPMGIEAAPVSVPPSSNEAGLAVQAQAPARRPGRAIVVTLAVIVLGLSAALGAAMIAGVFARSSGKKREWLASAGGAPIMVGENRARRFDVLRRALLHPIDFFVARGWSIRSSGPRSLGASAVITGYRELAPELPIRSGVRLDLDRIEIGFVDLLSAVGEPHDGRILLRRESRVLLNRNHPTVRDLILVAEREPVRARVLLEVMLATDPDLARGTDPRQVEWDLLGRAESSLRAGI